MIARIFKKFSGRHYRGYIKKLQPLIAEINRLEESYQSLSDVELQATTGEFKRRLSEGASLDDLLPEAYAVVKNAARRLCGKTFEVCGHDLEWNMVHFDVQLIGG